MAGFGSTILTYLLLYFVHLRIPQWFPLALLAGCLFVSFLVVGKNREQQIDELSGKVDAEERRRQEAEGRVLFLEEEVKKAGRAETKWRPSARIDSEPPNNFLVLKSDREFKIENISLLASNGAVLSEIEQRDQMLRSTDYRIPLSQEKITKYWNDSAGPRTGSDSGSLRIEVSNDRNAATFRLPFIAKQEFHANTFWIRLSG